MIILCTASTKNKNNLYLIKHLMCYVYNYPLRYVKTAFVSGLKIIDVDRTNFRPTAYAEQLKSERAESRPKRDLAFHESLHSFRSFSFMHSIYSFNSDEEI